jgi:hypothetical protein
VEKEEKLMETLNAKVIENDDEYFIELVDNKAIKIPISEDDPKKVKEAFNKLLVQLKKGKFKIALQEESEDLFCQVAKEYIKQLNKELLEVYEEMERHDLID